MPFSEIRWISDSVPPPHIFLIFWWEIVAEVGVVAFGQGGRFLWTKPLATPPWWGGLGGVLLASFEEILLGIRSLCSNPVLLSVGVAVAAQ